MNDSKTIMFTKVCIILTICEGIFFTILGTACAIFGNEYWFFNLALGVIALVSGVVSKVALDSHIRRINLK